MDVLIGAVAAKPKSGKLSSSTATGTYPAGLYLVAVCGWCLGVRRPVVLPAVVADASVAWLANDEE